MLINTMFKKMTLSQIEAKQLNDYSIFVCVSYVRFNENAADVVKQKIVLVNFLMIL